MQPFTLSRLPEIIFGAGRIADLAGKVESLAGIGAAVLVVADPMLTKLGLTGRALESLKAAGLEAQVFDGWKGEPKAAEIDAAGAMARAMHAKAIVGLGGGSALDTAKLVAACAASGLAVQSYQLCETPLPKNILPIIAVP
ncbi:MAG TPA: iron-containing alcohol dehydrogenase, partial [Aestuariivirga sp.]|nr:iron-containing alcohol dehydrogenase [Aestuariivirga sp.]